jgi:hypothetical protein
LEDIRRIYQYGIDVQAGFIIGFDNDTLDIFDVQYRFIMDSGIAAAMIGLLHALPRTPLYERLLKEGRLRVEGVDCDNTRLATNIVPKRMPYDQMVRRYEQLYHRLLADRAIADRINSKMRYMRDPVYTGSYSVRDSLGIVWRLLVKGILPGRVTRWWHFLRTLPLRHPRQLPMVVGDWITSLSMADYVARNFDAVPEDANRVEHGAASVRAALARYLEAGKLACTLRPGPIPDLSLSLSHLLDAGFYANAASPLERLLRTTRANLTLNIESFHETQRQHLDALLKRLARYGDRVSIVLDERLRTLLQIDSSVFNLVLHPR